MRCRTYAYVSVLLLTMLSCGRPDRQVIEAVVPGKVPTLMVVDSVLSGRILKNSLQNPVGLASGLRGNIYVVDAGNNRLIKFSSDLKPVSEIGGYGVEPGQLDRPSFVSFDNGLNLMVSDEGNQRISRFNSQMNFVDEIDFDDEDDPLKFGYPAGLVFAEYGELWVSDRDNNRIAVFSNVGRFDRFIGDFGYSGGQLSSPEKIVSSESEEFIVCDAGNKRLMYYDRYGNYLRRIDVPGVEYPVAAAVDGNIVWVLDRVGGRVVCIDSGGNTLFEVGPLIPGDAHQLKRPSDLLALPGDKLLISDSGNNRILVCRIVYEDR